MFEGKVEEEEEEEGEVEEEEGEKEEAGEEEEEEEECKPLLNLCDCVWYLGYFGEVLSAEIETWKRSGARKQLKHGICKHLYTTRNFIIVNSKLPPLRDRFLVSLLVYTSFCCDIVSRNDLIHVYI